MSVVSLTTCPRRVYDGIRLDVDVVATDGGAYSCVICLLSHLTVDHGSLSRRARGGMECRVLVIGRPRGEAGVDGTG